MDPILYFGVGVGVGVVDLNGLVSVNVGKFKSPVSNTGVGDGGIIIGDCVNVAVSEGIINPAISGERLENP